MAENETVKMENEVTSPETKAERTFTQDELNKIVQERVAKERAGIEELKAKASKLDEIEEANKSELQKANEKAESLAKELEGIKKANELQAIKLKVQEETGVSASYLNGQSEEECRAIANNFKAFAEANKTPVAPIVRDGGESAPITMTKESILNVKNERERLKLIEDNIELFK